jgi:hypothetical protein
MELSRPQHSPAHFMSLVFALLARGYRLDLQGVRRASYHAVVRNAMDQVVGDLTYRDPSEEPPDSPAVGISYGSYLTDPQFERDVTFQIVVERM